MVQLQQIFANAAKSKEPIDVFGAMHNYTLDVFAEIGFGTEMKALHGQYQPFREALEEAEYVASARYKQPTAVWKAKRWLNVGSERKMRHAIQVIDEHVMGIISGAIERHHVRKEAIEAGRAVKPVDKDLVSIILDTMEASNEVVDPVEVRNITTAAIIAGRGTTADGLGWLFHLLSENPRVEKKLRSELLATLPRLASDEKYLPPVDELNEVPYLEATIRELLRLLPPGSLVFAHCARDTTFPDRTLVAKNTDIAMAFYSTARLRSVWGEDASEFKPERFLDPETGKALQVSSSKFCTFSTGPRMCVSRNLAFIEMKIVIANVVGRFHLVPEPDQNVCYTQGMTLGMQNPLVMRVEKAARKVCSQARVDGEVITRRHGDLPV
jgi:cytochrome P450